MPLLKGVCYEVLTGRTGPGHYLEVQKMLPLLTAASPDHPSFHVVALSLPAFGCSDAPKEKGFSIPQHAEVRHMRGFAFPAAVDRVPTCIFVLRYDRSLIS